MAQVGAVLHVFDEDNGEELQEINAPNGNGYSDNCIFKWRYKPPGYSKCKCLP